MKIRNDVVERVIITCKASEVRDAIEYLNRLGYFIMDTFYKKRCRSSRYYTGEIVIVGEKRIGQ